MKREEDFDFDSDSDDVDIEFSSDEEEEEKSKDKNFAFKKTGGVKNRPNSLSSYISNQKDFRNDRASHQAKNSLIPTSTFKAK